MLQYVIEWVVCQYQLQRLPLLTAARDGYFCLGDIEKCFSIPRDHLAMMGTKGPARLIVMIIVAEPTF